MDAIEKAKNTQTVLQSVTPTFMPTDGEVMTLMIGSSTWKPVQHGASIRRLGVVPGIAKTWGCQP